MAKLLSILQHAVRFLAEVLIRGYQVALSPLLIGSCKFVPSCSDYCIEAIREWGIVRGGWLGIKRIVRCRPFTMGGIDPVPKREASTANKQ
jgi:hypothetical protein